jgi:hypothetical protein
MARIMPETITSMRTTSLISIAFALLPSIAFAAALSGPVNVTVDPPVTVQQLPFLSMTRNSTFVVWSDTTTSAGRMMTNRPIASPVVLDTVPYRDAGAASVADQSFGVWLQGDWIYGQYFNASGTPTGAPVYLAMVDSRHTMRMGVGAGADRYLVAWAAASRVLGAIVDTNGNIPNSNNMELDAGIYGRNVEAVKVASIGDEFLLVWETTGDEPWVTPCSLQCPSDDREVHALILDKDGNRVTGTERILADAAGQPDVVSNGTDDYFVVWTSVAGAITGVHISRGATSVGATESLVAANGYGPRVAWDGTAYDLGYVDTTDIQALRALRLDDKGRVRDVIGTPALHHGVWPRQFGLAALDGVVAVTYVDGPRLVISYGREGIPVTRTRAVRH